MAIARLLEPVEPEQLGDVARALARGDDAFVVPKVDARDLVAADHVRATTTLTSSRPRSKSRISSRRDHERVAPSRPG